MFTSPRPRTSAAAWRLEHQSIKSRLRAFRQFCARGPRVYVEPQFQVELIEPRYDVA